MNVILRLSTVVFVTLAMAACSSLPDEPPPLADMEEPLEGFDEPADESLRATLDVGGFSGVYVEEARTSLDDLGEEPEGVLVSRIVENSPGEIAGLEPGDILLEAISADGEPIELNWPSEWRKIELDGDDGTEVHVIYDRAGVEGEATLRLLRRVRRPDRHDVERFREEDRVGVVLRTATEVESRALGLGPGGGAVVVGLARSSPWRRFGLRYGDTLVAVAGNPVAHPQVLLDAIRNADPSDSLRLDVARGDERRTLEIPLSDREDSIDRVNVPPLFCHEAARGRSETSVLMGFVGYEETKAAWELTLLWFIKIGGGDSDELEKVDEPAVDGFDDVSNGIGDEVPTGIDG